LEGGSKRMLRMAALIYKDHVLTRGGVGTRCDEVED